jgi:MFS family permease
MAAASGGDRLELHPVRQPPARSTAKALSASWPVFAGITLLMLGNGLQGTLLGTRATLEEFGTLATGFMMACYYVGFIASSFGAPLLIQRAGHVRCYAAFAAAASVAVLMHGLVIDPFVWSAMRATTGFCLAGIYIVSESWLNGSCENTSRGSVLSIYNMVLLLSVAGGQMAVALGNPASIGLFVAASALISLAVLPMALSVRPAPEIDTPEHYGLREITAASPLGVVLALGAGLIYGAYGGMGAAFATGIGLSTLQVSLFMTAITIAGAIAQWPVGAVSDVLPRHLVALASMALAAVAAVVASASGADDFARLVTAAAVFGAASLPLYALAIAITNDRVPDRKRVAASSTLILLYGLGSIAGPILSAGAIEIFGDRGFFLSLAAICGVLAVWSLARLVMRGVIETER